MTAADRAFQCPTVTVTVTDRKLFNYRPYPLHTVTYRVFHSG